MLRPILATLALSIAGTGLAAETAPAPAPARAPTPAAEAPVEQKTGLLLDRVIAVVNEGVITQSELVEQIAVFTQRLKEQRTAPPPAAVFNSQILERLILQEVQLQRAELIGLKISDEQLNGAIAERVAEPNGMQLTDLPAAMAQQGIDYALFRDNFRKEMTLGILRQREVIGHINVTPREMEQFIERIKRLPDPDIEYDTSHILLAIPQDATQAQVEAVIGRAQAILELSKTENFSTLAATHSNSADAVEGGGLGWRKGPALPTIFQEAVVGLKPGEISRPLVDANGVHLVRLNDTRGSTVDPIKDQVHVRHILVKPNDLLDDSAVQLKLSGIRDRVLKGEEFGVFASSVSEDLASAVEGGDLGWKGIEEYVPEFAAVIESLKDNQISEPFQSRYGWHMAQLMGRRKFDTTEESLRDRAYNQLIESREGEETELWLRRLRDEAFIDIYM